MTPESGNVNARPGVQIIAYIRFCPPVGLLVAECAVTSPSSGIGHVAWLGNR